jgi:pimeloyl-ACP methyl ester carboxylesterase
MFANRTVAVDMRGYGDSDKPGAVEDYKMPRLVNDVKEIIDALGTCIASGRVRAESFGRLQRKN